LIHFKVSQLRPVGRRIFELFRPSLVEDLEPKASDALTPMIVFVLKVLEAHQIVREYVSIAGREAGVG